MTYKMDGFPQLGGGDDKKPKTLESKVNDFLGNPKRAAAEVESRYSSDEGGKFDKGRDRARHMTTAQYTTEGVRNKLDMIPFSNSTVNKLVSVGLSNILGAAHEAKAGYASIKKGKPIYDTIVETAEDLTNNFAGSIIGAMDRPSKKKMEVIDNSKLKGVLPDGRYKKKGDNTYNKNKN